MRKTLVLVLLLSVLMPACMRKKDRITKPVQKIHTYDEDIGKGTTYDENVGAFVLEDDAGHDIFAEAVDAHKGESQKASKKQSDLDDAWAWQELDEDQPTQVIHFDYDRATVRPDQESTIRYNAQLAKPACEDGATIVVEGYSCLITRSQMYNQAISQKRADVVKKRLVELGVPGKCIKAVGRGTSCLVTQADGKEGQAPNRRVEVKFIYPQGAKSVKHVKTTKTVKHAKQPKKAVTK